MYNSLRTIAVVLTFILGIGTSVLQAQSLDDARQLYKEGKYEEAAPIFAKELKRKPNNGSVNHWYGVCLYEMGQHEDAVKYLTKGVSRKVKLSNLYLGKNYAAMYHFSEAVEAYNAYIAQLEKDKDEVPDEVRKALAMSKMGARMMRGVERVQVIDSILVDSLTFFESFRLSPESGRWLGYNQLPTSLQISDSTVVAYMPQRGDMMFMGHKEETDYDLYQASTLVGNDWGNFHSLSQTLNTADNQNYPFQLSDGQTLYFAQDGETSLGGYDIFVTMFNSGRGDYMLPQNVGMPFNSTHNDYMMAIDETLGVGWFVTDRQQIPGKLTIYIFIPNETKEVYDEDDENIYNLARLSCIADTWLPDADYSQLLNSISQIEVTQTTTRKYEFTFVVCDEIVYHHSTDFQNPEALHFFNQSLSAQQKLNDQEAKLNELRDEYCKTKGAERERLRALILQAEAQLLQEDNTPLVYANRARRAELSFLGIILK